MSPTNVESRVREVFARQAAALTPPDVRPDDVRVVMGDPGGAPRPRGRTWAIAAAVALLVGTGMVIANRHAETDFATGSQPAGGFHYSTPQVVLDAAAIEVDAGGRTFVPPANVDLNSDPGTMNEYTTLELSWDAQGTPMKINIYFASDGTDWWASEVRTYDGSPGGEWIETQGTFFRSPLGTAFAGDVDIKSLHMHGVKLEAFLRPAACESATTPLTLVSDYAQIETTAVLNGGLAFGATVRLVDTATCQPVATDTVSVSITSDDPSVAASVVQDVPFVPIGTIRVDLALPKPGATTVHVSVRDKATDELIDQIDIPVIVDPPSS